MALEPPTEHLIVGSDSKNLWYNVVLTLTHVFDLEIQTLVLAADVSSVIAGTVYDLMGFDDDANPPWLIACAFC